MSELDREQAGAIEDEADDNDTLEDEIELTPMAAETAGQSSLKKMMRSFLEMFTLDKGNLILNMMNNSNWEKTNDQWLLDLHIQGETFAKLWYCKINLCSHE